ncbi:hypothetical protein V3390_00695 [Luteimonas sp. FXH3W]|uniref:Glycosyltransferase involved in cell wall biosynthesis n=1 Tax=Aquilutibacter rugosus TaxID=3115820 RepID=A0ABU7UXN0_9GAMM
MTRSVCILAGSSLRYLPYLSLYARILEEAGVEYEVIYWDRHEEDEDRPGFHRYARRAKGRGSALLPQYYGFRRHILARLKQRDFDLFVVLGMQIGVFLADFLKDKAYLVDIRDRSHEDNPVYRFIANRVLAGAKLTCVSSRAFKQWLPEASPVVVSHNMAMTASPPRAPLKLPGHCLISYIGEVKFFQPNREFMEFISRTPRWKLAYHGAGPDLRKFVGFAESVAAENIEFSGRFDPSQKEQFYLETDFVLCLYGSDHINVRTALPNRLYEACIHARPLIVSADTYLADVVAEYGLGIVLGAGETVGLDRKLEAFFDADRYAAFVEGCRSFLNKVMQENEEFRTHVIDFVQSGN